MFTHILATNVVEEGEGGYALQQMAFPGVLIGGAQDRHGDLVSVDLSSVWDGAQLLEKAQRVDDHPLFSDLVVCWRPTTFVMTPICRRSWDPGHNGSSSQVYSAPSRTLISSPTS